LEPNLTEPGKFLWGIHVREHLWRERRSDEFLFADDPGLCRGKTAVDLIAVRLQRSLSNLAEDTSVYRAERLLLPVDVRNRYQLSTLSSLRQEPTEESGSDSRNVHRKHDVPVRLGNGQRGVNAAQGPAIGEDVLNNLSGPGVAGISTSRTDDPDLTGNC